MSGSYYTLNQKYNTLLSLLTSGTIPPYPPAADVMTTNTAQTVTAVKTFSVLPESSVVPTTNDQLVNKAYADALATETLQQVLDNGNSANDQSINLQNTIGTPANIAIFPDSITMANALGGVYSSDVIIENPTTFSQAVVNFSDTGVGYQAEAKLKSQSNQTEYTTSVVDTGNNLSASKSLITIGGSVLNTDTATNSGTSVVATSTANTSWALGANTSQIFNTGTGIVNTIATTCDATTANQQNQYKTTGVDEYTTSVSASNSGAGFACSYQTDTPTTLTLFNANSDTGGSSAYVQASNLAIGSSHLLRLETPLVGGALIEHQVLGGASRNLTISTSDNLLLTSDTLNATATNLSMTSASAGGALAPLLTLTNTNTTGSVAMEIYKNKPTAVVAGDVLFNQSVFGKDSGNLKQEYTRITHTIRDGSSTTEDGSIEFNCFTGGAIATFLQINGVENEINALKTIDLGTTASIRSSAGNIDITANASSGTGDVNITAKRDVNVVSNGGEINISTASSTGSGDIDITGKSGSITTLTATLINLNSTSGDVNLNSNVNVGLFAGTDIDATATTGDINLTSTAGDVNIISNGSAKSINLTSVSNVEIEATGDNLTLTAGAILQLDSNDLRFINSNVVTSTPNHTSALATTSNISDITTYLKVKLNNADIWIPYFTVDPNV